MPQSLTSSVLKYSTTPTVDKAIVALKKGFTTNKIITLNKRKKQNLDAYIDELLPVRFRMPAVRKLFIELFVSPSYVSGDHDDWVSLSSTHLKNSYESIYKKHGKSTSIFQQLLDSGLLITDGIYSKKTGKTLWYRLNDSPALRKLKYRVRIQYLRNTQTIVKEGMTTIDTGLTLPQLIDINRHDYISDTFNIKDEANVTLTGLTHDIINYGLVGQNYVGRELYLKVLDRAIKRANIHLGETLYASRESNIFDDTFHMKLNEAMRLTSQYRNVYPPHKDTPPNVGGIGSIYPPCNPTIGVELVIVGMWSSDQLAMLDRKFGDEFPKLMTIFFATESTCDALNVLYHRAPQIISYTGRFFESHNLGTTGLSRIVKQHNYNAIEEVTGYKVNNYDLRSSQVSAISNYCDKHKLRKLVHINKYANDRSVREKLAKATHLPVKTIKVLILISIFGGKNKYNGFFKSSYTEELRDVWNKNMLSESDKKYWDDQGLSGDGFVKVAIDKFNLECRYILADIDVWLNTYVPTIMEYQQYTADTYTNGATIVDKAFLTNNKMKSAFLLQGLEAVFIFELIRLSRESTYNYYMLSYEYDGIISLGEIPNQAIERAKQLSGFSRAMLEKKPIH